LNEEACVLKCWLNRSQDDKSFIFTKYVYSSFSFLYKYTATNPFLLNQSNWNIYNDIKMRNRINILKITRFSNFTLYNIAYTSHCNGTDQYEWYKETSDNRTMIKFTFRYLVEIIAILKWCKLDCYQLGTKKHASSVKLIHHIMH
jgi:hypothetical protein